MASAHPPVEPLRSYGRRRGRALSARQSELWRTVLPRLVLPSESGVLHDPGLLFTPPKREVWLEIGFGGGEHLLWQAKHHPDVGLIGCEPFENGIVKVLVGVEADAISNIRIHPEDVRTLLPRLPAASIARTFILFPDPWPKLRHRKRRLISAVTLEALARVLQRGGELRIATDDADYAGAILLCVRQQGSFQWLADGPADWRTRPQDWPGTRYEAKALRAGRRCLFFRFQRI